jgi:hypothetical protein
MTQTQIKEPTPAPELFEQAPEASPAEAEKPTTEIVTLPPSVTPASMLQIIAAAAANPSVDVDKMRALLDMQREIMAEDARIAFTQDFLAMDLPVIDRDGRIDEGITRSGRQGKKTNYATFENINKVIKPKLKENGFVLWFEPDVGPDHRIIIRGHLDHVKGHGKTCAIPLALEDTGKKNNAQATGSTISYGKRYATIALLNLISNAPEDRDTDANVAADAISAEQKEQLIKACEVRNAPLKKLVAYLNQRGGSEMKSIDDLPANRFDEAMETIKTYGPKS